MSDEEAVRFFFNALATAEAAVFAIAGPVDIERGSLRVEGGRRVLEVILSRKDGGGQYVVRFTEDGDVESIEPPKVH